MTALKKGQSENKRLYAVCALRAHTIYDFFRPLTELFSAASSIV